MEKFIFQSRIKNFCAYHLTIEQRICYDEFGCGGYLVECYLKPEVDKVIADLEESHKMEVGQLLMEIVELKKEERRWRKFSEEKPKEKQWILVYYPNHSNFSTGVEVRRWDEGCKYDVEVQEIYDKWRPLPSAPKEEK